jgi:regulator of replication initiation timing
MSEIDELHARIVRLEDRLENYHEWLESSLEENTRFQLHATGES